MSGLQNAQNPACGDINWRRLAADVRHHRAKDHRGIRALAPEIGITVSDLSRVMSGQVINAGRVIALCDWMGRDIRDFYIPPKRQDFSECFSMGDVKQAGVGV